MKTEHLAGIEYHGIAGASYDCQNAVERILHFNDRISAAKILTHEKTHCLLLKCHNGDEIAIKSGFSSGYLGEGPRRFSYVLQLLDIFEIDVEEYGVAEEIICRIDASALRKSDLRVIERLKPMRPSRWHEYVSDHDYERGRSGQLAHEMPPIVPLAIIDSRLMDLAIGFWKDPDGRLLTGYRRLEDIIRRRSGAKEHGQKLFSTVFGSNPPLLFWKNIDAGEKAGRLSLFAGAYLAHRNPRAHRELPTAFRKQISEFMVLNHLFGLESAALTSEEVNSAARRAS